MEQRECCFIENKHLSEREHPLHLHADSAEWYAVFRRRDTPCIVSLCHKISAYHSTEPKLFAVLHLDYRTDVGEFEHSVRNRQITLNLNKVESTTVLYSTNEFHQHYGINRELEDIVVGPVKTFPLSKILFSAETEETFKWVHGKDFETGLMVTSCCQKKVLVRRDDQFLASPQKSFGGDTQATLQHFKNLTALECFPVKQGYIHVNTEIIICRGSRKVHVERRNSRSKLCETMKLNMVNRDLLRKLEFESFHYDQQTDVICCQETADTLGVESGKFVNLEINFPLDDDGGHMLGQNNLKDSQDVGDYLSIDVACPVGNPELKEGNGIALVVCRILVGTPRRNVFVSSEAMYGSKLDLNKLYLSPLLWFNIMENRFSSIPRGLEVKVECLQEDELPPFASEIHLSLVLSPTYSPGGQYDQTLMKHLSPRVLKKNSIIMICTKDNPEYLAECDAKDMGCQALYYKVRGFSKAEDTSSQIYFRFDFKRTSVYQDGTENSFIPNSIATTVNSDVPAGLSAYVDQLHDILHPYVTMAMNQYTPTVLLSGGPGCGKWSVISTVCRSFNLHVLQVNCYDLMADSSGAMEAKITTALQRATVYAPCVVILNAIDCIGRDKETDQPDYRVCATVRSTIDKLRDDEYPIIVIATTCNKKEVVSDIRVQFIHQVDIRSPSENQRSEMLSQLLGMMPTGRDVDVAWLAKHTVGFTYGDMWELLRQSTEEAKKRITDECSVGSRLSWIDEMSVCAAGMTNQQCDFATALKRMQSQKADIIGVPKIPNIKWDDIGGLEDVKQDIKDTIQLPLEHPELVASGLRRSGVLLYGPPGTGKTLLAKAVATMCSLSFLSVKGPELINMYVGQSEENVRNIFSKARDAAPCVVFFDELDSLTPNRGRSGDSGGVMDRVVSQMLAELDGLVEEDDEKQIFVIGASNRPDLIDNALLRPGRFDKLIYVGINKNKVDKLKVLTAQTRKCNLDMDVNLEEVVDACPENMTGADFYALTSAAVMNAIRRRITAIEVRDKGNLDFDGGPSTSEESLIVEQDDLLKAAKSVKPSVSEEELARFNDMRGKLISR